MPGMAALVPVPWLTTDSIMSVSESAVPFETGVEKVLGSVVSMTSRFLSRTDCTRYGVISLPPFAIAALTIAICSGVARTSNWPMADCASWGLLRLLGKTLGVTDMG